ncbi:MAG: aldo/keto reductase [Clostridiales Family XIII bacterium]|nr:aldo/keto reductase [Clostridiales Family XIII bacterium]
MGNTGIFVPPVGMGVLTVGRTQLNLPLAEGAAVVRYALERGIDFLDTAEYYETYPYIRAALAKTDIRPVIASKSLSHSYAGMDRAIEDMRSALNLDVIDIFLLHEVREAPDFESRVGAWTCLCDAKAKGRVRAIGISTHYVDVARLNAALPDSDILFPLINMESLGVRDGAGPGTKEDMAAAIRTNSERGKGVFTMKVFGGGNLTGSYLEALDYVSALPGVDSIMVGMGKMDEVDRLAEYAEGVIDRSYVPDIKHKKIRIDRGDCEGCGACVPVCPGKAIRIEPDGIAAVNHDVCITCGYCAAACPVRAILLF